MNADYIVVASCKMPNQQIWRWTQPKSGLYVSLCDTMCMLYGVWRNVHGLRYMLTWKFPCDTGKSRWKIKYNLFHSRCLTQRLDLCVWEMSLYLTTYRHRIILIFAKSCTRYLLLSKQYVEHLPLKFPLQQGTEIQIFSLQPCCVSNYYSSL